jgi:hypothetical protein
VEKRIPKNNNQQDEYLVTWEINIIANSPEAAAKEADNLRATSKWARVYNVFDVDGEKTRIDIDELDQEGYAA